MAWDPPPSKISCHSGHKTPQKSQKWNSNLGWQKIVLTASFTSCFQMLYRTSIIYIILTIISTHLSFKNQHEKQATHQPTSAVSAVLGWAPPQALPKAATQHAAPVSRSNEAQWQGGTDTGDGSDQ